MTDHSEAIAALRKADRLHTALAADLLELHDKTGISLDHWSNANIFVTNEVRVTTRDLSFVIQRNGV